jgi:hypothetical protein
MGYNNMETRLIHSPHDLNETQKKVILEHWYDRTKSLAFIARECAKYGKKPTDQAIKKAGFSAGYEPRGRATFGHKNAGNIKPNKFGIKA